MTWPQSWISAVLLAASPAIAHGLETVPQASPQGPIMVLSVGDGDTLTVLDGGHKRVVRLACMMPPNSARVLPERGPKGPSKAWRPRAHR
jgi:endonuclease YncB( thermonuclease family)